MLISDIRVTVVALSDGVTVVEAILVFRTTHSHQFIVITIGTETGTDIDDWISIQHLLASSLWAISHPTLK